MADIDLAYRAEALLFAEGGSMTLKRLATPLGCTDAELKEALAALSERLQGSGLSLIMSDSEATLAVSAPVAETVKNAFEKELGKEIGDAGLEVLAIVLYRGPSTRAHIDYIRGVNTSSTLRNLLARGLVERINNPEDAREYLYRPTVDLLAHLGVTDTSKLPEHAAITSELASFEAQQESGEAESSHATD